MCFQQKEEVLQTPRGGVILHVEANANNTTETQLRETVERIRKAGNFQVKRRSVIILILLWILHTILEEYKWHCDPYRWVSCGAAWWWWWWAMTQPSSLPLLTCHLSVMHSGGRQGSLSSLTSLSTNLAACTAFSPAEMPCYFFHRRILNLWGDATQLQCFLIQ